MRNYLTLKFILLVLLICDVSSATMAANATSQQPPGRILEPKQVNPGDRITVYEKSGRVLELIVDEVITTNQAELDTSLTGTYISEITSADSWYFRLKKHRELIISLEQNGNTITGSDRLTNSEIIGTVDGEIIKFEFWSGQLNNNRVTGEWKVNADGTRLEGSWDHGKWNLTRLDPVVATRHAEPPMIKGRLVLDQSAVEVLQADIDKIEVRHVVSTKEELPALACKMSEAARDAIDRATDAAHSGNQVDPEVLALVDEAEKAAGQPECDNVRAEILANEANELATASATVGDGSDDLPATPSPESSKSPSFEYGRNYGECLGKIAIYGTFPIIAGGADGAELSIFTTVLGTVICLPVVGTVASMESSVEASSRKNHAAYRKTGQQRFFALTRENLVRDMARGGGEYLTTMAYLEGCPVEVHESFAKMIRRNFGQIIPQAETGAEVVLQNLEAQIARDPLLVANCHGVS